MLPRPHTAFLEMVVEAVGPYLIIEKLGAGGMGEVYLAEDPRLNRRVALKTLPASASGTPGTRHQLLREARAAAALNHPNIAAVYDVIETESATHIVMEYVEGETLAALARRGPCRPAEVVDLALQVCDALAEAHRSSVIHRDLKPANIMVTPRGRIKVLDFGLAKIEILPAGFEGSTDASSGERRIQGTPPYVSPEHLLGGSSDARSDIYSLGVTLYELLAGKRPFAGPTPTSLAMSILNDTPRPLRALNPGVSAALEGIVARAMNRVPEDRYPSASTLKEALERLDSPSSTTITTAWAIGRARRGRLPHRPALVVGALLAALAAGAVFLRQPPPPVRRPPSGVVPVVVVLPFTNLSADPANDYIGVGLADFLTTSLSRIPRINVVSRNAAAAYRDRKLGTTRIARDLGADFVVDGAIHRSDDKIRVTLGLLRAGSDVLAWSRAYDGALREVLSLQREVADALSAELSVTLTASERQRVEALPTTNTDAMADYANGLSFLERPDIHGNVDRAIGMFRSAITRDPKFGAAHAGLGRAYWVKYGETKEAELVELARATTEHALELEPDDVTVKLALARIELGTGRIQRARFHLDQALLLRPDSDDSHRLLGRLLCDEGRYDEALVHLDKALQIRPSFAGNVETRAWTYFLAGRLPQAAAEYARLAELQPDNAWAYQMLGSTQHALGRFGEAISNYRKAVALGQDARAYANLGLVYYAEGRFEEAKAAYEQAARLEPGLAAVRGGLGDCYAKLNQIAQSRESYRQAVRLAEQDFRTNPADGEALASLALYHAKLGDGGAARRYAAEAARLGESSASVNYQLAAALAIMGENATALERLKRALKLGYSRALVDKDEDLRDIRPLLDPVAAS